MSDLAEWAGNYYDPEQAEALKLMLKRLEADDSIDHRAAMAALARAKHAAAEVLEPVGWMAYRRGEQRSLKLRREAREMLTRVIADVDFASLGLYGDPKSRHHVDGLRAALAALDREIDYRARMLGSVDGARLRRVGRRPAEPWIAACRRQLQDAGLPATMADELMELSGLTHRINRKRTEGSRDQDRGARMDVAERRRRIRTDRRREPQRATVLRASGRARH